jgi:hypothetical protein
MISDRAAAQRYAADELARLAADVAATGSGARNVTLNRAALAAGHYLGAGALTTEQAERALLSGALRAGLRESEARGTIRSGLRAGAREPAFQSNRDMKRTCLSRSASQPGQLGSDAEARYCTLMLDLVERCPMAGEVENYLRARGLPTNASPDVIALPAPAKQPDIVAQLVSRHGRDALLASGLADDEGSRLQWPDHRLGFVWRDAITGAPSTIQRRFLGTPPGAVPKTVFSRGRRVAWPWGAHLLRGVPWGKPVTLLEGVVDWLAWRALYPNPDAAPALALPSAVPLRPEWLPLLAGRDVFVALDSDEAGEVASSQIIEQLRQVACPLRIRPWPSDKDWGDCAARRSA